MPQHELSLALNDSLNLRLPIAGPGARAYAFLIDFKIRVLCALLWLSIGFQIFSNLNDVILEGIFDRTQQSYLLIVLIPTLIIYFLYHPFFELIWNGRTPGKRIAGIRVVDAENGTSPRPTQIAIRNVFRLIDSLPSFYALGIICSFFGPQRARLGDLAAGTALVHEAKSMRQIRRTLRQIEQKAALPDAIWDSAKSLLDRWSGLYPHQRVALFSKLAAQIPGTSHPQTLKAAQMLQQLKTWVG